MSSFKNWKLTFTADIVSTFDINEPTSTTIHEALAQALRSSSCGCFLVANDETKIDQERE